MVRDRSSKSQTDREAPEHRHEERDVNYRVIVFIAVLIFVGGFCLHSSVYWWLQSLRGWRPQTEVTRWNVIAPWAPESAQQFPALQLDPERDLRAFLEREHRHLHSYGWFGPDFNLVRIPIERAMGLIARGGLPDWGVSVSVQDAAQVNPADPKGDSRAHSQSSSSSPSGSANESNVAGGTHVRTRTPGVSGVAEPKPSPAASATNTEAQVNLDDAFLKAMADATLSELELGKLGKRKATSSEVQDLSRKMVKEQTDLHQEITDRARDKHVSLPDKPGFKAQAAIRELEGKNGDAFDRALAAEFVAEVAESLHQARAVSDKLRDPDIKRLDAKIIRKFEEHSADSRDAAKSVGINSGTIEAIIQRHQEADLSGASLVRIGQEGGVSNEKRFGIESGQGETHVTTRETAPGTNSGNFQFPKSEEDKK